jgi:hypothetical protein
MRYQFVITILITLHNFPMGQLVGVLMLMLPFGFFTCYNLVKYEFLTSKIKRVSTFILEITILFIVCCITILAFKVEKGALTPASDKLFS